MEKDEKKCKPEDVGIDMGNNAINDAIHQCKNHEELNTEMIKLRFAALYVLSSLGFNQAKSEGVDVFNIEKMEAFMDQNNKIIKDLIFGLDTAHKKGTLKMVSPGDKI